LLRDCYEYYVAIGTDYTGAVGKKSPQHNRGQKCRFAIHFMTMC